MKQGTQRNTKLPVSSRERDLIHAAQAVTAEGAAALLEDDELAEGRTLDEYREMMSNVLKAEVFAAKKCKDEKCLYVQRVVRRTKARR